MQGVNMKVPVSKCIELAAFSIRMFSKFPDNAVLVALAAGLQAASDDLWNAQSAYEGALRAMIPTRVDVKFENLVSDRRIRLTQQKVEIADGKKDGRIGKALFPEGSSPITRLLGQSQVDAMKDLEGRLEATVPLWSDATSEKADIKKYRESYKTAIDGRQSAEQKAQDLLALRDAAKDRFVTKYSQTQSLVEAEFPRDKPMQELFFDEVRTKSVQEKADTPEEQTPADGG